LQELGCTHSPEVWRRLVDFSKFCLKAELLHIGNIHPSIPTAHFFHIKEIYENMDLLLKAKRYSICGWKICGNLKDIGLFLGSILSTQNFVVFFVNGRAEQTTNIKKLKIGPCEKSQLQGKSVSEVNS
jgi:hypothetical protein